MRADGWGLCAASPHPAAATRRPPSPLRAGLSGEDSVIAELDLIVGCSVFAFARIDWRRLVDLRDGAAHEQELADELCKAERRQLDAVGACGDAQQEVGDHRGEDLQTNRVVAVAEEPADSEMLLDPAEQQFDLPAALVERGDLDCGALEIIGQQRDPAAAVALDLDASQRDRQAGVAFADEPDLGIIDDGEAVADAVAHRPEAAGAQAHVGLRTRDEETTGIIDLPPPVEAAIALVVDIGHAGFDLHLPANLDVVDVGRRNLDAMRHVAGRIVDHVHLYTAELPFAPLAQLAQR